ncbi:S8 family serine peptidase [Haliangium sp.]|uniref:S8 family serine peptidase n=1 Tax=Haliangium sp. TaxID=2663208 RepID=UPI003D0A5A20
MKKPFSTLTAVSLAAVLGVPALASADTFVVMANGNKLDNGLRQQLEAAGGAVRSFLPEIDVAIIESDDPAFATRASAISGIHSVTPDMAIEFDIPVPAATFSVAEMAANPPVSGDDDAFFDLQWGHDAVDAPEAWDLGYRGAGVRVAVLDSGIDAEHPDIAPNLNLALSTSFVPGEDVNVRPGVFFNHGTHVAGTIAGADNGIGIIGVAPEAEIVAVKVLSEFTGSGSFAGIIEGLVYAANIDADVINMSLGADIPHNVPGAAELFVATGRATTYAYQQGVTIIASAGNDARDMDHDQSLKAFPAELPHVLSISATAPVGWALDPFGTNLDNLASYSNYGQNGIDLAAPGGDFVFPGDDICNGPVVVLPCFVFDLVVSSISEGWSFSAGTSMAAPHASGVAALIIGANGGDMDPAHVAQALRAGADDLGKPGNDDAYGQGRVNAAGSL